MNAEVKQLWVEALRCGIYKQGTGGLRSCLPGAATRQYCCLGVLCDVYLEQTGEGRWTGDHDGRFYADEDGDGHDFSSAFLPEAVRVWAGLSAADPGIHEDGNGRWQTASECNDGGWDFAKIADAIEENL